MLTLKNSISQLPLQEQILLLEDLLISLKEKVFQEIEKTNNSQLWQIYRVFQLNVEILSFQNILFTINKTSVESKDVEILKLKYSHLPISWSENEPNPDEFFGIWKENPKTIEEIRDKAWKRN